MDIAESTLRIAAAAIPADHIVLMAGFTAGNDKGELVVLGRNGSDYSAAVLAACLRADCCEIWTDVDGVYTCDPRTVPDAGLLKSMSYQRRWSSPTSAPKCCTLAPSRRLPSSKSLA